MASDPDQGPTGGLTPHLGIHGHLASEAIAFYKKAFGAEELRRMPEENGPRLMHAHILINGASLMLHDEFPEYQGPGAGGEGPPRGVTIHLQVDDADTWFSRAIDAGATEKMALQDMFWGDRYGQLTDPFGYDWSIAHSISKED